MIFQQQNVFLVNRELKSGLTHALIHFLRLQGCFYVSTLRIFNFTQIETEEGKKISKDVIELLSALNGVLPKQRFKFRTFRISLQIGS